MQESVVYQWGRVTSTKKNKIENSETEPELEQDPSNTIFDNIYSFPTEVKKLTMQRISSVSCGAYHNMGSTDGGIVWSWGEGQYGQLGHADKKHRPKPTIIKQLLLLKSLSDNVSSQIVCGSKHSMVLTSFVLSLFKRFI